jgi:hypothetical protein
MALSYCTEVADHSTPPLCLLHWVPIQSSPHSPHFTENLHTALAVSADPSTICEDELDLNATPFAALHFGKPPTILAILSPHIFVPLPSELHSPPHGLDHGLRTSSHMFPTFNPTAAAHIRTLNSTLRFKLSWKIKIAVPCAPVPSSTPDSVLPPSVGVGESIPDLPTTTLSPDQTRVWYLQFPLPSLVFAFPLFLLLCYP